ncbi:MAG TPA: hypothetical protein PLB12_08450 [Candidatus Goldiibacteriota bacterium]|nr:hypothetical protein [Candidatus Goldiibacteriota bacterium]HPN64457.1 hypothetical protein [Candidatus Goldiibacteriota bacterium]HRQ44367.1 hypothetical protein [Candidatus Goldiibacteriota bacterium]
MSKYSTKLVTVLIFSFFISTMAGAATKLSKAELKARGLLCSFEKTQSDTALGDFLWETYGYVKLEQFKKHATKGKFSAKATFSVPADFLTERELKKTASWISPMVISIDTLTKLKVTDWSQYKKMGVDIFNNEEKNYDFYVKINDASGREYLALRPVKKGKNKLELIVEDITGKRIDVSNIVSVTLYLDTKAEAQDVVLYIDNLRLMP